MVPPGSCQCALSTRVPIPLKSSPHALSFPSFPRGAVMSRAHSFRVRAELGGEGEVQKGGKKKKFITKEEEPEQYWQTAGEREGENPMMTPLPYIIIFGMSTPFVILAIAFANGWIKVPVR
ncbi:hypothetical protein MLD38_028176 [Melastoma candidum]|uniref:Uncharacterized protein n=1 Tax=Melastoma candidum TaxID=119954 RepID=A0ACB9MZZ6_9MYRT|nr:hypothetical protein MLD38_028176 [Melastoma candidum]